jgi:hypothetical protein
MVLAAGCQGPRFARSDVDQLQSAPERTAAVPTKHTASSTTADVATDAQVMREVQQISADNPEAGKLLLDELSRAEPKLWPATVQQFRSRQAFHDQLLKRSNGKKDEFGSDPLVVASQDRPSTEVGQLTDPRAIGLDPATDQAFAQATPANMPAPFGPASSPAAPAKPAPAALAEDPNATPLARPSQPPSHQEILPTSGTNIGHVQPALYSPQSALADKAPQTDWQQNLRLAIEDLQEKLVDGPKSTAEVHQVVSLRLLELLSGDTEAALKPIPNVSTEEQDYWSGQLFALATFLDHHRQPDDDRRAAASVVHLDEAVGHLRELGTLSLRNLAFCKNVYGYGAYEAINSPSFTPGQQVTLYLEVENYHSESTQKGYTTKLGASYELSDEEGQRVAKGDFPNIEDCCQSRRRDFHIQYGLVLPKTAKPGKYRLALVMHDRQSEKRGTASIACEIR